MFRRIVPNRISKISELPDDEAELMRHYQQTGDMRYIGKLYEPYTHLVFGVCLKYLKNREDSQDAVMQIFEKIVIDVRRYEIKHFKSWLYTLTKNYCLMELRRKKIQISHESAEHLSHLMDFSHDPYLIHEMLEKEKHLQILEQAIRELSTEQRKCVELFFLQQKSYRQIAQETDYSLKKVKSYIQNGKRKLKILMMEKINLQ